MHPVVTEQEEEERGSAEGGETGTGGDRPPQGPTKGNGQKGVGDNDQAQISPHACQGCSQVGSSKLVQRKQVRDSNEVNLGSMKVRQVGACISCPIIILKVMKHQHWALY